MISVKIVVFVIFMHFAKLGISQQCRQITVCDENQMSTIKGVKGDVGAPGKSGPVGMKGPKGEVGVGQKGEQGESCSLVSFEPEIREKLLEMKSLISPESCVTSLVYGRQRLRSGQEAFCDNGWTVFQRRLGSKPSVSFDQGWTEYKFGFGYRSGDFWLGLEHLHSQMANFRCQLRIDIWSRNGAYKFAEYSTFSIANENDKYRLHVNGYSGTAGDGLIESPHPQRIHNNMRFTTKDSDNDAHGSANCAVSNPGGWWYNGCTESVLNREPGSLRWDDDTSVQASVMKFLCE